MFFFFFFFRLSFPSRISIVVSSHPRYLYLETEGGKGLDHHSCIQYKTSLGMESLRQGGQGGAVGLIIVLKRPGMRPRSFPDGAFILG